MYSIWTFDHRLGGCCSSIESRSLARIISKNWLLEMGKGRVVYVLGGGMLRSQVLWWPRWHPEGEVRVFSGHFWYLDFMSSSNRLGEEGKGLEGEGRSWCRIFAASLLVRGWRECRGSFMKERDCEVLALCPKCWMSGGDRNGVLFVAG